MTPLLSNYIFLLSYEIVVISEKGQTDGQTSHTTRVEFLPEEMTFFRTGGRKWKKLISSAEDLEESGRFGRKWNKWNITNIKNKIHVL